MNRGQQRESWSSLLIPVALIAGLVLLLSLNVGSTVTQANPAQPLEDWLKNMVGYLAAGAEIAAALVIGFAILQSLLQYIRMLFFHSNQHINSSESIRLRLGRILALGLEFTVASDILRTAVAPSRQDILNLGAIVLLRSLLNYFLEREIRQGEENSSSGADETGKHPVDILEKAGK